MSHEEYSYKDFNSRTKTFQTREVNVIGCVYFYLQCPTKNTQTKTSIAIYLFQINENNETNSSNNLDNHNKNDEKSKFLP